MDSCDELRAEIVRLEKLLSEKDETLEKMSTELAALVKFVVISKSKLSSVTAIPNFTLDGQDVPLSKF
jgi:hypothetical protein